MSEPRASIPSRVAVQRHSEAKRITFGPTDSLRFMSDGGEGVPEFYEEVAAQGDGPPLHSHPWPSWEFVLDGRIRFVVADEVHVLEAGDSIYIPSGAVHSYVVESESARAVGIGMSDGRFSSLQRQASALMDHPGGPPMEDLMAIALAHNVEIVGPPLTAVSTGGQ